MASACVNNIAMSPENFLDFPPTYPSYGWLSPRVSFSREFPDEDLSSKKAASNHKSSSEKPSDPPETSDPDVSGKGFGDFEFRLDDPVTMLPADELFSDGKLMPLQLAAIRPSVTTVSSSEIRSPETAKYRRKIEVSNTDPYLFSPKAPRCSSRWKEILGLKKLYQNSNAKQDGHKTTSSMSSKSLKHFLHRNSKSSNASTIDSSLSLPLLKDSDSESVSISSRLSLSSSSSGHELDDLPRLSLDSEKPNSNHNSVSLSKNASNNPPRVRLVRSRAGAASSSDNPAATTTATATATATTTTTRLGQSPMRRAAQTDSTAAPAPARTVSIDSPRMNSSGKIVFQGLERSSSSPSSLNGGPRFKHRGVERSYSANVRVTPVLNVPVCSLRGSSKSGVFGFPLFSSPQKRESNGGVNRGQSSNIRNRNDRV